MDRKKEKHDRQQIKLIDRIQVGGAQTLVYTQTRGLEDPHALHAGSAKAA
jgi:hypothetical protein